MKKLILLFGIFLCACTTHNKDTELSEADHIEIAERHIFEVENIPYAKKHLQLAVEKFNSESAAIYLARLYFHKYKSDKTFMNSKEGFPARMRAWPFLANLSPSNKDAAFMKGLIYYGYDDEIAFKWFKVSAELGHAAGMIYLGSLYHHLKGDNENALVWVLKALQNKCSTGTLFAITLEEYKGPLSDSRDLELLSLSAISGSGIGQHYMGLELEELSKAEAEYWQRLSKWTRKQNKAISQYPIYDLYGSCRF